MNRIVLIATLATAAFAQDPRAILKEAAPGLRAVYIGHPTWGEMLRGAVDGPPAPVSRPTPTGHGTRTPAPAHRPRDRHTNPRPPARTNHHQPLPTSYLLPGCSTNEK